MLNVILMHQNLLFSILSMGVKWGGLGGFRVGIGQSSIDFLGVCISNGKYTLQPHIAISLNEFPNKLTSAKQIQQFLGIVNYMSDFIPKISKYKNCLAQLLKKNSPEWNSAHTEVV